MITAKVEQISWSDWSEWSECTQLPDGKFKKIRSRDCILQSGLHLSRADPCFLLDKTPNVDTVECEEIINSTSLADKNDLNISEIISSNLSSPSESNTSLSSVVSESVEFTSIQNEVTTEDVLTDGYELSERSNFLEVTLEPKKDEDKYVNISKQPQLYEKGLHVVHFSKSKFCLK